jgi:prevent-host-death family protein
MIDLTEDIRSVSDFKRNTQDFLQQMEASGRPIVLTVNGKAKLVVQDAESYQKLLDAIDEAEAVEGIRRGLEDVKHGRTKPLDRAFADIRKRLKIPRRKMA